MKHHKILLFVTIGVFITVAMFLWRVSVSAPKSFSTRFWNVEAVDTVKYSRDLSANPAVYSEIPVIVRQAAALHVTHIALGTPYDEQFYPVLKAWVTEARKYHLSVWFRGNFSGWEGWFGYPQFSDVNEHNTLTHAFILKHPDLFEDGDIFTPAPEPENGGFGDPRQSDAKAVAYNNFLVSSYNNCVSAFSQIQKSVTCGYFSMNGDIANQVLTPQTVAQIGNRVVIDHYVDSPQAMDEELTFLEQKFPTAKIVLGEFGAPIPDINGDMTPQQQADFIQSLFDVFYNHKNSIEGIDYWTLAGGSTSLLDDKLMPNPAFQVVANQYNPAQIEGRITDTLGNPFAHVTVKSEEGEILGTTDSNGYFAFPAKVGQKLTLIVSVPSYQTAKTTVDISGNKTFLQDIKLSPQVPSIVYKIKLFFAKFTP